MTVKRQVVCVCARVLCTVAMLFGFSPAHADDPILVVRNATAPDAGEARFTEADLTRMPQVTIRTRTDFTDGVVAFVGPLARDVVAFLPAGTATIVHLVAANDYAYDIPLSDFADYDVILAMEADGKRLSLRDKGPLWVMYPLDDFKELQDPKYNHRLVWQLTQMELR